MVFLVDDMQLCDAIEALSSNNTPRNQQIIDRIKAIYCPKGNIYLNIVSASLEQFTKFFLELPEIDLPKITLTLDGNLKVRWIYSEGNYISIEFIGGPTIKLVADMTLEFSKILHGSLDPIEAVLSSKSLGVS